MKIRLLLYIPLSLLTFIASPLLLLSLYLFTPFSFLLTLLVTFLYYYYPFFIITFIYIAL
jgi:hypothetical protein